MAGFTSAALLFLVALAASAAGGCDSAEASVSPDPAATAVMVIDDGFDTSTAVLRGRVVATYQVSCEHGDGVGDGMQPDTGADTGSGDDDLSVLKAGLLAELARRDDSCHLEPGLRPANNPFVSLEAERSRWNEAILTDRALRDDGSAGSLWATGQSLLAGLASVSFHGTATAGIVAEMLPHLVTGEGAEPPGLVLVRLPFDQGDVQAARPFSCLPQSDIDMAVALLNDADMRRAFRDRPPSRLDAELAAVRAVHGIGIVNESFGQPTRQDLERTQWLAGCPPISLAAFFETVGALEQEYQALHPVEEDVLVVHAAGNDGVQLESRRDSLDCAAAALGDGPSTHLLVGSSASIEPTPSPSSFTNRGPCVDLYAPGEDIVVHLPGDWLFPLSGTSFATPLVAGLLARDGPPPFTPAISRRQVLERAGVARQLPSSLFPARLLFRPQIAESTGTVSRSSSLSRAGTAVPPSAAVASENAAYRRRGGHSRDVPWPLREIGRMRVGAGQGTLRATAADRSRD